MLLLSYCRKTRNSFLTADGKRRVRLYDSQKLQRVSQPRFPAAVIGCLPLKKPADRPWYNANDLRLTGARLATVTYRCVFAAARSTARRQCPVQYMVARPGAFLSLCVSTSNPESVTSRALPVPQKHMASFRLLTYPQFIAWPARETMGANKGHSLYK